MADENNNRKTQNVKGPESLIALFLLAVGVQSCNILTSDWKTGEAKTVGIITQFAHSGLFFKTHDGALATNSFIARGNKGASNTLTFSVNKADPDIMKDVSKALTEGACVSLSIDQTVGYKLWEQGSRARVTAVTFLPPDNCGKPSAPGMR